MSQQQVNVNPQALGLRELAKRVRCDTEVHMARTHILLLAAPAAGPRSSVVVVVDQAALSALDRRVQSKYRRIGISTGSFL